MAQQQCIDTPGTGAGSLLTKMCRGIGMLWSCSQHMRHGVSALHPQPVELIVPILSISNARAPKAAGAHIHVHTKHGLQLQLPCGINPAGCLP